jgi:hypothetical protein
MVEPNASGGFIDPGWPSIASRGLTVPGAEPAEARSAERDALGSRMSVDDVSEERYGDVSVRPPYVGLAHAYRTQLANRFAVDVLSGRPTPLANARERRQLEYLTCARSPDGHQFRYRPLHQRMGDYLRGRTGWMLGAPDPYAVLFVTLAPGVEPCSRRHPSGTPIALRQGERLHSDFEGARRHAAREGCPARSGAADAPGAWVARLVGRKEELAHAVEAGVLPEHLVEGWVRVVNDGSERGVVCPFTVANYWAAHAPRPGEVFFQTATEPVTRRQKLRMVYRAVGLAIGAPIAMYLGVRYGTPWAHGEHLSTRDTLYNAGLYTWFYRTLTAGLRQVTKIRAERTLEPRHDHTWTLLAQLPDPRLREASLFALRYQLTGWRAALRGIDATDRWDYRQAINVLTLGERAGARTRVQAMDVLRRAPLDTYGRQVTGLRGWLRGIAPELRDCYAEAVARLRDDPQDGDAWRVLRTAPLVLLGSRRTGLRGVVGSVPPADRVRYADALAVLRSNPLHRDALGTLSEIPLDICATQFTGWRGAMRGIHRADRDSYRLAIAMLRRNPCDTGSLRTLMTAPYKILTPSTPFGRLQEALRDLTLAWNNADYMRLTTNLFLDPAFHQWCWPVNTYAGANRWISDTSDAFYGVCNAADFFNTFSRRQLDWLPDRDLELRAKVPAYKPTAHRPAVVRWVIGLGNVRDVTHSGMRKDPARPGHERPMAKPPLPYRWGQYASWADATGALAFLAGDAVWLVWSLGTGDIGLMALQAAKVTTDWGMFLGCRGDYIDQYRAFRGLGQEVYFSRALPALNVPLGLARMQPQDPEQARIRHGIPALTLAALSMTPRVVLQVAGADMESRAKKPPLVYGAPFTAPDGMLSLPEAPSVPTPVDDALTWRWCSDEQAPDGLTLVRI